MKAMETDSQATIQNQETTINSLKKEKEVRSLEFLISVRCTRVQSETLDSFHDQIYQKMNGEHCPLLILHCLMKLML